MNIFSIYFRTNILYYMYQILICTFIRFIMSYKSNHRVVFSLFINISIKK